MLTSIIVLVIVLVVVLYIIQQIPLEPQARNIVYIVVLLAVLVGFLRFLGLL